MTESIHVVDLEWCVLDPRVGLDRHRPRFLLLLLFVTVRFAKFRAFILWFLDYKVYIFR